MKMQNRLYVESLDGGHTNEVIGKLIKSEVYLTGYPVIGGGSADVVEVSKDHLAKIIKGRVEQALKYNVYDKSDECKKLRPIVVGIKSNQITLLQVLNKRIGQKLVKIRRVHRLAIEA